MKTNTNTKINTLLVIIASTIFFTFLSTTQSKYLKEDKLQHSELEKLYMFNKFIVKYNKEYSSPSEFQEKFSIFKENLNDVSQFDDFSRYMDMRTSEFNIIVSSITEEDILAANDLPNYVPSTSGDIPKEFDWTEKGIVSPVKDQGDCQSCWAFSTTGNIEALYALKYQESIVLSEQQIVDCTPNTYKCAGGSMVSAMNYLKNSEILMETEKDYPYESKDGECRYNKDKGLSKTKIIDINNIGKTEEEMMSALIELGPLSVAVKTDDFQFYTSGIIKHKDCLTWPNHGILLVGYGEENGVKFWKLKNSFGEEWGEKGYVRIERGKLSPYGKGNCCITDFVSSVILA